MSTDSLDLTSLTSQLDALSRTAEQHFHAHPRATRTKLTTQTRIIFQSYAKHGSAARLRHNIKAFLETADEDLDSVEKLPPIQPMKHQDGDLLDPAFASWGHFENTNLTSPVQAEGGIGSRTVDPDSSSLVTAPGLGGLEFRLDRSFVIDADTKIPDDLLPSLSRILELWEKEAELLLSHHCEKYPGIEAVARAGVREYIMSRTDNLFTSIQGNDLGLTPETREFLFSVYERHPDLNTAEKRMLVRATRLDEETIDFFWDDMTERRKSYLAMRQVIAARELRELRVEKAKQGGFEERRRAHYGGGMARDMF